MFANFLKAVQENDLNFIEKFVETQSTSELNKRNTNKRTLLHECVKNKCTLEILKYLLKKGCDPNVPDAIGNTVVYEAILRSCGVCYIKLFFESGSKIAHRNYADRSILLFAIEHGNNYSSNDLIELIEYFLSLGSCLDERIRLYPDSISKEEKEEKKKFAKFYEKKLLGEIDPKLKYEDQLKEEEKKEVEKQKEFEKDKMFFISMNQMVSSPYQLPKNIKPFNWLKLQNYPAENFLQQLDYLSPPIHTPNKNHKFIGYTVLHFCFYKMLAPQVIKYICKKNQN